MNIHTDTAERDSGYLENKQAGGHRADRCSHAFHTEGRGGGIAPAIYEDGGNSRTSCQADQPERAPYTVNRLARNT